MTVVLPADPLRIVQGVAKRSFALSHVRTNVLTKKWLRRSCSYSNQCGSAPTKVRRIMVNCRPHPALTPRLGEIWPSLRRDEKRRQVPDYVRQAVFARDDFRCCLCGLQTPELHLDHIIPWSAGGTDGSSNLRALCGACNIEKASKYYPEDLRMELPIGGGCLECEPHNHRAATQLTYCRLCGCISYSIAIDCGRIRHKRPKLWEPGWRRHPYDPTSQPGSNYRAPSWEQVRDQVLAPIIEVVT